MRLHRDPTVEDRIQSARDSAFETVSRMNRQERRTAKGKMLVAQAEAAAMRAENKILREELGLPD